MRRQREYLQLIDKAKYAAESAIDFFNRVNQCYKDEAALILLTNAWELLAKAILVKRHSSIRKDRKGNTISAEVAVSRIKDLKLIDEIQEDLIQQIISLRHACIHHVLPPVPQEIAHHLLYFGCKFFRELIVAALPAHAKSLKGNYLSMAFSDMTTYADKVQKLVSRVKSSSSDKKLVWLLERGIKFDGENYITESQFANQYRGKRKIMPHLAINNFIKSTDMVRIVPVQAPRNFTADIILRKGSAKDASLPVLIKKTNIEDDYPHLTKEIATRLGKSSNYVAKAINVLGMKGNPHYHQAIRASKEGFIQRYSEAALVRLREYLAAHPEFDPYHMA